MLTFYLVFEGLRNVKLLRVRSQQPKANIGGNVTKNAVNDVVNVAAVVDPATVGGSPIKMKFIRPSFGSHPFRYYFYWSDEGP